MPISDRRNHYLEQMANRKWQIARDARTELASGVTWLDSVIWPHGFVLVFQLPVIVLAAIHFGDRQESSEHSVISSLYFAAAKNANRSANCWDVICLSKPLGMIDTLPS